jgi:hypothetical protein
MKLAFLISAHTDAVHLARLIASLPLESEFFVHIDAKSDIEQFTRQILDERVHFLLHREDVIWGSWIEVRYQMELIRAALKRDVIFDYLITLSGMDYPIWSNRRIVEYLKSNQGKQYLQGIRMSAVDKASHMYMQYRFLNNKHWKNGSLGSKFRVALRRFVSAVGIRKPLEFDAQGKHYSLYKGAAWWAITPSLANYVLESYDNNAELDSYFSNSFCPAETFVQTVAFNSPYADRCIATSGRYTTLYDLTPLTYIDYNPVVQVLTEKYLDTLKSCGKMFCRKVCTGKSDGLMKLIDEMRA